MASGHGETQPVQGLQGEPGLIRLAVMLYARFPFSLRKIEDRLHERGIDVSHETVRFWWHRFGPKCAAEIRKRRIKGMCSRSGHWHFGEVFVKIAGEVHDHWLAVDRDGEVRERYVAKTRDKKAALSILRKATRKHRRSEATVTDKPRSCGAATRENGACAGQETGRWKIKRAECHTCRSDNANGPCFCSGGW